MTPEVATDVRRWLLEATDATLCTLCSRPDLAGHPYGSVVPYAVDETGRPFVLLARIAAHTADLRRDARATLFIRDPAAVGDPQASWRAAFMGRMVPLGDAAHPDEALPGASLLDSAALEALAARYQERVPAAAGYRATHDFDWWRLDEVIRVRAIGGFGEIHWVQGHHLLRDPQGGGMGEAAPGALEHLNLDHGQNLIEMCIGLAGITPEDARAEVLDRTGLFVRTRAPDQLLHFSFGREIEASDLRRATIEVLRRARAARAVGLPA